jgi:uncharacterized membrane protein YdjX (TVP38/TMEM64 family)
MSPRAMAGAKLSLVVGVAIGMLVAYSLGVFEQFAEPERLARQLVELGPWGYVLFIGAYTVLQPFGVPGTVFVVAAPLIWPWPTAFALTMVGTMAASVVGFSFARFVARDFFEKRIPERFRRYDEALEARGFVTVLTLRFLFWMPQLLHAFFGVSKVRFWTHFWGSLAGYFVPLLAMAFFGEKLFEMLKQAPPWAWLSTAAVVAVVALFVWRLRRRARTLATAERVSGV